MVAVVWVVDEATALVTGAGIADVVNVWSADVVPLE